MAVRDNAGRFVSNRELCRAGLHSWSESAVLRGGINVCRECANANGRRYKAKKRPAPEPPPSDREWRAVPDYEALYLVSEHGDVWSLRKHRGARGGILRASRRGYYWHVTLVKDSQKWVVRLHVLVALAFIGPRPEWAQVIRHLDDDPSNNHVSNIAYGTFSDNMKDAWQNTRYPRMRGSNVSKGD